MASNPEVRIRTVEEFQDVLAGVAGKSRPASAARPAAVKIASAPIQRADGIVREDKPKNGLWWVAAAVVLFLLIFKPFGQVSTTSPKASHPTVDYSSVETRQPERSIQIPQSSGSTAVETKPAPRLSEAQIGFCLIEVRGRSYLNRRCNYERDSDGSTRVGIDDDSPFFAYVNVDSGDIAQGSWNEDRGSTHAHSPLGTMHRNGDCWVNQIARVCASNVPLNQATTVSDRLGGAATRESPEEQSSPQGVVSIDPQLKRMMIAVETSDSSNLDLIADAIQANNKVRRGDKQGARRANENGLAEIRKDDFVSAIDTLEAGSLLDSSDQEILNNLGFALYRHGDYDKAASAIQKSLLLNPRRTPAWANLSQALAKLGYEDEAVQSFLIGLSFSKDPVKTMGFLEKYMEPDDDNHTKNVVREIKRRVHR
jgi:hypothetical protein